MDAFSYLVLGHVFVANMTGNVVFLAFALVGAKGFSIGASLAALAAFAVGAGCSGRIVARLGERPGPDGGPHHRPEAMLVATALVGGVGGRPIPGRGSSATC